MMTKELDSAFGKPPKVFSVPLFYNLHLDPRGEHPVLNALPNVWVRFPAGQVLLDHASLFQKETPIREEHSIPTCRRVINLKRPLELGVKTRAFVVQ
jgi:hypothetical protein